jgi:hypothetical protein
MRRVTVLLAIGSFGLVLSGGFATARDGFGHGGRSVFRPMSGFGGWHRPWGPGRRHPFPGYLDGRGGSVNVVIQQNFVTAPAAPAVPTVLDLPVNAGIREALPAQPAVIVVNERSGARETGTGRMLSGGPKIINTAATSDGRDQPPAAAPPFGARIVHLTVPVGR